MKTVRVYNIDYCIEDEDDLSVKESRDILKSLPKELVFRVDDDCDPSLEIADLISDHTGWLVNKFNMDVNS